MPLGVLFSKEIKVSLARYMMAGEREERGRREGGEREERGKSVRELCRTIFPRWAESPFYVGLLLDLRDTHGG